MQEHRLPESAATTLLALASRCHARGWAPATSGNFSVRLDAHRFVITKSGLDKGALRAEDLLVVDLEGTPLTEGRPSAETPLHAQIYRRRSRVTAVAHTHSVAATVLSRALIAEGYVVLSGFEMLKALVGVNTHETSIRLPIFPNDQDVPRLAAQVDAELGGDDCVYGYLLAGHGLYTWGETPTEAARHVEAIEFLLECVLHGKR
ncbi:methylthioribulose 1-phosphate dehydratase [Polyangium sp. y55x31]|uniref:methylthioribulose 1-phosphate dehydratase n=1 Tax=Polyangium sp. y55x31 TaxID=3042688 RepID=UPI002482D19C|nr:methylthioribulose 1-phosphate dehydratase [Polyangium sp. y55x31]MDI1481365.1 methylthioribulose 1-phosphate dehydratase [Polyangium sp. y55x31]